MAQSKDSHYKEEKLEEENGETKSNEFQNPAGQTLNM